MGNSEVIRTLRETILKQTPAVHSAPKILKRTRATKQQSHLDKKDRHENIKNVFTFTNHPFDFASYQTVALLNAAVTAGATMAAARATLAPHLPPHISLTCLAIAH